MFRQLFIRLPSVRHVLPRPAIASTFPLSLHTPSKAISPSPSSKILSYSPFSLVALQSMASAGGCVSCEGHREGERGKEKEGRRSVKFSDEGVETGEHGGMEMQKRKEKGEGEGEGEGEREREGRKIMVAVDESVASIEALRWAARNIVRGEDSVILLHAQHLPPISTGHMAPGSVAGVVAGTTAAKNFQTEALYEEARSRELMEVWKEFCSSQNVKAEAMVRMGEAGDVICGAVEEFHVDLLVLGSHGYGPIKRCGLHPSPSIPPSSLQAQMGSVEVPSVLEMHDSWALLGSVSDYCVHHSICPVVVVKKRD